MSLALDARRSSAARAVSRSSVWRHQLRYVSALSYSRTTGKLASRRAARSSSAVSDPSPADSFATNRLMSARCSAASAGAPACSAQLIASTAAFALAAWDAVARVRGQREHQRAPARVGRRRPAASTAWAAIAVAAAGPCAKSVMSSSSGSARSRSAVASWSMSSISRCSSDRAAFPARNSNSAARIRRRSRASPVWFRGEQHRLRGELCGRRVGSAGVGGHRGRVECPGDRPVRSRGCRQSSEVRVPFRTG